MTQDDYKKLAELLYPNAQDWRELEKKYPPRKTVGEVTRFAPSPTGYLHIGHYFPNIISKCTADSTGGLFYIRLEDTDQKREVVGASNVLFSALNTFGIRADEGRQPDGTEIGNYGPYTQSQRKHIYEAFAKKVVASGLAFPCFCDVTQGGKKEALARRQQQIEEGDDLVGRKDPCRDLTLEEIEKKIKAGGKFALRLRSKANVDDKIKWTDEIRGEIEMQANSNDVILMKSDGLPPYAFAHAVDDHLMRTTLVVRGEEWMPSTPAHIEIFKALEFPLVKYLHPPVILKIDAETGHPRKISKSKDPEFFVMHFLKLGYPTEAVTEYVLNLANSAFEPWRLANPNADIKNYKFNYHNIGSASPMYDEMKLNNISKNVIATWSAEKLLDCLLVWAKEYNKEFYDVLNKNKDYSIQVLNMDRCTERVRKDIIKYSDVPDYLGYMFNQPVNFEFLENLGKITVKQIVESYIKNTPTLTDNNAWFEGLKNIAIQNNFSSDMKAYKTSPAAFAGSIADVANIIRIAITGKQKTGDLYLILKVLGYEEVSRRLKHFLSVL